MQADEVSADSNSEAVTDLERLVDIAYAFARSPIVATESIRQH
jgi:hypothetical protein